MRHRNRSAAGGEQAVSFVRSERHDAALLDINMPGIAAIEACREMRRLEPNLPILMLTLRDDADDKIEALDVGADDYITKPFHTGELMARVRVAVRRSHNTQNDKDSAITIGALNSTLGAAWCEKGVPLSISLLKSLICSIV